MVNNIFKIIDENKLKFISVKEYKDMVKLSYLDYCHKIIRSWDEYVEVTTYDESLDEIKSSVKNKEYIECDRKMMIFRDKYFEKNFKDMWVIKIAFVCVDINDAIEDCFKKHYKLQDLLDYLNIIPFTPSVMINISPDWKSGEQRTNTQKIKLLKLIVEQYLAESERYDHYSYVIENGSDGEHIHAHIVAHINPKIGKSVCTHLNKGNHTQQLKKYASKLKGMGGIIKGPGVQKCFLRTEQLVSDKLDYLIEEKKPEGHKNKSIIDGGLVVKTLFTVK